MIDFNFPGAPALLLITVANSLYGLFYSREFIERSLFRPYWFLRRKQYSTLVMSGMVHADLAHLLFNMVTFFFFAIPLERIIGTGRFLLLYLASLALSEVVTYMRHKDQPNYASLGASGAVSAVLFAYIVYSPLSKLLIFPLPVPIPAYLFAVLYLGYSYYAAQQGRGRINHDAHWSGAVIGLAFVCLTDFDSVRRLPEFF